MQPTITDANLRTSFRAFVVDQAEPWHRAHLGRLYTLWDDWNARFFQGRLAPPYILFSPPESARAYGDCAGVSSFGGRAQIRIRPSLLTGTHRHLRGGDEFAEGRARFVADVLLHECVHQWHFEITGQTEDSYHGHGPAFAAMCNQIGAALGLPPVRAMKRRGKDKDLPSCAQWPICVRHPIYYLGAYTLGQADDDQADGDDQASDQAEEQGSPLAALLDQILADIDAGRVAEARAAVARIRSFV
jgi:hypothetical protein